MESESTTNNDFDEERGSGNALIQPDWQAEFMRRYVRNAANSNKIVKNNRLDDDTEDDISSNNDWPKSSYKSPNSVVWTEFVMWI